MQQIKKLQTDLDLTSLSNSSDLRLTKEFLDIFKDSNDLSKDLLEFQSSGKLKLVSPELNNIWGANNEQDAERHPEGSVAAHTLLVLAALPKKASIRLKLAAAYHDIGKPLTLFRFPGTSKISHKGHAHVGANLFRNSIGAQLGISPKLKDEVAHLIDFHMIMHNINNQLKVSDQQRELILKMPLINEMTELQHADVMGTGLPIEMRKARSVKEFVKWQLKLL